MGADRFLDLVAAETGLARNVDPIPSGTVAALLGHEFGLDGSLTRIATEKDDTFRLDADDRSYLVKVSQAVEDPEIVDLQSAVLRHLESTAPGLPVQRLIPTRTGEARVELPVETAPHPRILRVLSFVPGTLLADVRPGPTQPQLAAAGAALARVATALADFAHRRDDRLLLWDLALFHRLRALLGSVRESGWRRLAEGIVNEFEAEVAPRLGQLPTQVIHGDFSPHNVVVAPGAEPFVTGVIDFGDTVRSAVVFDVAVGVANQIGRDSRQPWAGAAAFVAGYCAERPLSTEEVGVLRIAGLARLALRALVAEWRAQHSPDRLQYLLSHAHSDWTHLARARAVDRHEVDAALFACASHPA
jgi:Ser/Thr protein kinase RdoA (MazF antagonist)